MGNKRRDVSPALDEIVFEIDAANRVSSDEFLTGRDATETRPPDPIAEDDESVSPVFRELANPRLPELPREARARLLMQSPSRVFFYWSVGAGPYAALNKALGNGTGGYTLALRLLDLTSGTEELHPVEAEGSWWFSVMPGNEYRAEIGFYSPSRPFVRILFSNTVHAPRKGPSPRSSSESRWAVTTGTFAELLDVSGFGEEAYEMVTAERGQNLAATVASHIGVDRKEFEKFELEELRRALAWLASGLPIIDLKWKISAELYALLEAHLAKLSTASIRETLGIAESETEQYEKLTAVGGSLVNIPKRRFRPISSLDRTRHPKA